jgi:flagellar hook assembly protein FlgD
MLGLVGREVTVAGDQVWLDTEGASTSYVNAAAAGQATIEVVDATGAVVDTYTRDVIAGRNDISWDGQLADQEAAPAGEYTLRVEVENNGQAVPFVTLMTGPVTGLRYEENLAIVQVGDREFYVSEIYQVS